MSLTLSLVFKPAYYALVECAEAIAFERGHDEAMQWADKVLSADFDLFCMIDTSRKPQLRLIQGGR